MREQRANLANHRHLEATEATRALMLGQEGYAGNLVLPAKASDSRKSLDAVSVSGVKLDEASARRVDSILESEFPAGEYGPTHAVVNTEDGYSVLNLGNEKFADRMDKIAPQLTEGYEGAEYALGRQAQPGLYGELDWKGGNATANALATYDAAPALRAHADSPAMRSVAGDMAGAYEALAKSGAGMPYDKLMNVLRTWSSEGLEGVQKMVKAGLAPAVVLSVLSQMQRSNALLDPSRNQNTEI